MTFRARGVAMMMMAALLLPLAPSSASVVGARGEPRSLVTVQRVRIIDDAYRPRTITITRGTRVRWRNAGTAMHTVTSNAGTWDSGLLGPGDRWGRVFKKAGTFKYHCSVHPTMTGVITVT